MKVRIPNSIATVTVGADASYLESQDMLRMSGIERDVYLYTQPKVYISDYYAYTNLDDNSYKNGVFKGYRFHYK